MEPVDSFGEVMSHAKVIRNFINKFFVKNSVVSMDVDHLVLIGYQEFHQFLESTEVTFFKNWHHEQLVYI